MLARLLKAAGGARWQLALGAVCFSVGAASAIWVDEKLDDAARARAYEAAIERQQSAFRDRVVELKRLRERDGQIITGLRESIDQVRANERVVTKEVIRHVPTEGDGSCNLTLGAVGLLNDARRAGGGGAGGRVPETPDGADGAGDTASAVTQRAEVAAHAECAHRYEELRARHNALLDWIEQTYGNEPSD